MNELIKTEALIKENNTRQRKSQKRTRAANRGNN